MSGNAVEPVDALVQAEGAELGIRTELVDGLIMTLSGFWMELDSELLFVGDAGTSEPNDTTRRIGLEFSGFWNVNDWLTLDASYTRTEAEFKGLPAQVKMQSRMHTGKLPALVLPLLRVVAGQRVCACVILVMLHWPKMILYPRRIQRF